MIKVIAIGNILLSDDGIGVKVLENLEKDLKNFSDNIQVIIGETDCYYCLDNIEGEDFLIILDSTYFGIESGSVIVLTLEECDEYMKSFITAHEDSLINILRRQYREVKGYLIGIEIAEIGFSLELSTILQERFQEICLIIKEKIKDILYLQGAKTRGLGSEN